MREVVFVIADDKGDVMTYTVSSVTSLPTWAWTSPRNIW